jgi:DivIVA domain-containing protein
MTDIKIDFVDVQGIMFERAAWGRRGYDEDQVDQYLDMVADELARLRAENTRAAVLAAERARNMTDLRNRLGEVEEQLSRTKIELGQLRAEAEADVLGVTTRAAALLSSPSRSPTEFVRMPTHTRTRREWTPWSIRGCRTAIIFRDTADSDSDQRQRSGDASPAHAGHTSLLASGAEQSN